jgi:hypothetical protein
VSTAGYITDLSTVCNRETVAYLAEYPIHKIEFFVNEENKTDNNSDLFFEKE